MLKNTSSQKLTVFAFADAGHASLDAGEPVTGDAANITMKVEQDDDGTQTASNDTNPTEVEDGHYRFDLTQAETNGDKLTFYPESSTAGVQVVALPSMVIYTRPPNFSAHGNESDGDLTKVNTLDGHTAQTGDSFARLGAPAGASVSTDIATVDSNVDTLLTRITSTLFSGITSLAEWLGQMAGKQAADATAQTEIRATGAGSGTFDATTDSTEALRDHIGDGTNLPEAGGDGDHLTEAGGTGDQLTALATSAALATVDSNVDDLKSGIILGAAATGTLSTTQASTNLSGYADDQLIGRIVTWLSGACEGESSDITDYANTNGVLTFTALTTAPSDGDTFKIT